MSYAGEIKGSVMERLLCRLVGHRWGPELRMSGVPFPGRWFYRVCGRCWRDWAYTKGGVEPQGFMEEHDDPALMDTNGHQHRLRRPTPRPFETLCGASFETADELRRHVSHCDDGCVAR